MKRLTLMAIVALLAAGAAPRLLAQATATASRAGGLQVGGAVSIASPDYGQKNIEGLSVYADLDITTHLGAEVVAHKVSYITPTDIGEDTYLIGPRYTYRYKGIFEPYAKILFGFGRFQYQYDYEPHFAQTYGVYAGGAGLDIRVRPHVNVRAIDFEYQKWPGFGRSGLTPYVASFGAAYVF